MRHFWVEGGSARITQLRFGRRHLPSENVDMERRASLQAPVENAKVYNWTTAAEHANNNNSNNLNTDNNKTSNTATKCTNSFYYYFAKQHAHPHMHTYTYIVWPVRVHMCVCVRHLSLTHAAQKSAGKTCKKVFQFKLKIRY